MKTEAPNNNRLVLLLIAGLPVTVIMLASWLWFYVASGKIDLVEILGAANRGELLSPPLPLQDIELRDSGGELAAPFAGTDPRWRILIPGTASCEEECRHVLHYTRQIHSAMGKFANRIERVYLLPGRNSAEQLPQSLRQQYPGLKVLYTSGPTLAELLAGTLPGGVQPAYYLVDPQGWVMMYYSADMDGKNVMADLKFLLKNSNG